MTENQVSVLHFREEEQLFAEIDRILKRNALYTLEEADGGFILSYWWGDMYEVIKPNALKFILGAEFSGKDIKLKCGDIIILEATTIHRCWFYVPRLLIGQKTKLIVDAKGYVSSGLFSLIRSRIIRLIYPYPDHSADIKFPTP